MNRTIRPKQERATHQPSAPQRSTNMRIKRKGARVDRLAERLRRQSRKVTGPRQSILEILRRDAHPLSIREIFQALPEGEGDLATVYRSMHLLEKMGIVKRF